MNKFLLNQIFNESKEIEIETTNKFQNKTTRITITTMKGTNFDYKPYLKILNKQAKYIYKSIIKEMYPIYKSEWSQGKPLSPQAFIRRINLDDITFRVDQNKRDIYANMWFDSRGLFTDHTIIVNGSFKNNKYVINEIHI